MGAAAELNADGKTQAQIAGMLGIPRQTIGRWLDISNAQMGKANIEKPDNRVQVSKDEMDDIADRVEAGESCHRSGVGLSLG